MSSSDKNTRPYRIPMNWDAFKERDVPVNVELISPAAEVASLLQGIGSMLSDTQQCIDDARDADLQALACQGVLVVQLASALEFHESEFNENSLQKTFRHFRVIKDQMLEAIEQAGLQVFVPLGEEFDKIADDVHVVGWRHNEAFESEQVVEVIEPIVRKNGRLIHMGRVVMGAPSSGSDQASMSPD